MGQGGGADVIFSRQFVQRVAFVILLLEAALDVGHHLEIFLVEGIKHLGQATADKYEQFVKKQAHHIFTQLGWGGILPCNLRKYALKLVVVIRHVKHIAKSCGAVGEYGINLVLGGIGRGIDLQHVPLVSVGAYIDRVIFVAAEYNQAALGSGEFCLIYTKFSRALGYENDLMTVVIVRLLFHYAV